MHRLTTWQAPDRFVPFQETAPPGEGGSWQHSSSQGQLQPDMRHLDCVNLTPLGCPAFQASIRPRGERGRRSRSITVRH